MSNPSVPPSAPARSPFPRRVVILFLLAISTALGLILLFKQRPATPLVVAVIFTDLTLGLVVGIGTRIFLRNRGALVRFFAGTGTLIIGLYVLGLLTDWRLGFGPLKFWRDTIDWIGLGQISLGTLTFLLTLQAWSKPIRVSANVTPAASPARQPAQPPPPVRPKVKEKRKKLKQPRSPVTLFKSKPPVQARASSKPVISSKKAPPVTKPKRSIFRRKPQVRLSKIERHLCPYCLDPVTRNDTRGVVECDICHTLHHGDCWAIAGACQVPHYTS